MKEYLGIIVTVLCVVLVFVVIFLFGLGIDSYKNNKINTSYNGILSQINSNEEIITYTQNTFDLDNSDKDIKLRALAENRGYKVTTNVRDILGGTHTTIVFRKEAKSNQ